MTLEKVGDVKASVSAQMFLLCLATFAANYGRTMLNPLQESLRTALALTDGQIALLQGPALALPIVALAVPLGLIVDRYVRVRLLVIFALVNAAGNAITAGATSFSALMIARSIAGVAGSATPIAAMSLLADLYGPAQRGRATTAISVSQAAGAAAAFACGGALLGYWEDSPSAWRYALWVLAIPLLLLAFSALAMREPARVNVEVHNPSVRESWHEMRRYRTVIALVALGIVSMEVNLQASMTWAEPALMRTFQMSSTRAGSLMAIAVLVSGIVGPIVGGVLADAWHRTGGPRRTAAGLSWIAVLSLPASLFCLMPTSWLAIAALLLLVASVTAACVGGMAMFTLAIPNELRGFCMGLLASATILVSVALAPLLVSALSGYLHGATAIAVALASVCGLASVLAAGSFAAARPHFVGEY